MNKFSKKIPIFLAFCLLGASVPATIEAASWRKRLLTISGTAKISLTLIYLKNAYDSTVSAIIALKHKENNSIIDQISLFENPLKFLSYAAGCAAIAYLLFEEASKKKKEKKTPLLCV